MWIKAWRTSIKIFTFQIVLPACRFVCLSQVTPKEAGNLLLLVSYSFRVIGQKFRVGMVNTKTLRWGLYGKGQFKGTTAEEVQKCVRRIETGYKFVGKLSLWQQSSAFEYLR